MKLNRWVYGASSLGMVFAGGFSAQACSSSSTPDQTQVDAGHGGNGDDSSTPMDSGTTTTFVPGDGGPCTAPVGQAPLATCDPSDEQAMQCTNAFDAGGICDYSDKCGDLNTCEPFTKNPKPGSGVDTFRMRLINLTAPAALANPTIQGAIITSAVDLPSSTDAGGAPCGENGTGLFNWIISVDQKTSTVTTGGAPPSTDPFGVGYCFINATIAGSDVAPLVTKATFTGTKFTTTTSLTSKLNIPIFVSPTEAIILPISGGSLNDVDVSTDGECIGQINPYSSYPASEGAACVTPTSAQSGPDSCSRWHTAGTLSGYITLADANNVSVVALGGEELCVLLLGTSASNGANPPACKASALTSGDYCSPKDGKPGKACPGTGDSVWLSAQFAASAVALNDGKTNAFCDGSMK